MGVAHPKALAHSETPPKLPQPSKSESGQNKEYKVKSAFLYNFISYTTWPEDQLPPKGKPIIVAVVGPNPFGKGLDTLLKAKQAHGHKLEARYFAKLPQKLDAQVVFCSDGNALTRKELFRLTSGKPMLVIGEHKGFAGVGGHVNFYFDKGKIRFEVNLEALRTSKLTMSSQLLKLAKIVK